MSSINPAMIPDVEEGMVAGKSDEETTMCAICFDAKRDVRLPCGHAIACEGCIKRLLADPSRESHCPTCRKEFSKYHRIRAPSMSAIGARHSFVDPSGEMDFGQLVGRSWTRSVGRHAMQSLNAGESCFRIIALVLVMLIVLAVALLPLALGITELVLGIKYSDKSCQEPLASFLICAGVIHVIQFCFTTFCKTHGENPVPSRSERFTDFIIQLAGATMLCLGAHFAYTTDLDSCPKPMADYVFYWVTISFSIFGLFLALFICACCVRAAVRED